MATTSMTVGGLEIGVSADYFVSPDTLSAIQSGTPREPRLVNMAGDHPAYVGWTPTERSFPLIVHFRGPDESTRRSQYLALESIIEGDLVPLVWTEDGDTKGYMIFCGPAILERWYKKVTISAVAPDPVAS